MANPEQIIHPSHKNILINIHKLGSGKELDVEKKNIVCE